MFKHNEGNQPLKMWLIQAKRRLLKNKKAKRMGEKMQICYGQPRNLKRIATQKKQPKSIEPDPGCKKYGK
jgi:hypothetical protein